MKKYVQIILFFGFVMPSEGTNILELKQYQKSDKAPSVTYADLEYLIKKWIDPKIIVKNYLQ